MAERGNANGGTEEANAATVSKQLEDVNLAGIPAIAAQSKIRTFCRTCIHPYAGERAESGAYILRCTMCGAREVIPPHEIDGVEPGAGLPEGNLIESRFLNILNDYCASDVQTELKDNAGPGGGDRLFEEAWSQFQSISAEYSALLLSVEEKFRTAPENGGSELSQQSSDIRGSLLDMDRRIDDLLGSLQSRLDSAAGEGGESGEAGGEIPRADDASREVSFAGTRNRLQAIVVLMTKIADSRKKILLEKKNEATRRMKERRVWVTEKLKKIEKELTSEIEEEHAARSQKVEEEIKRACQRKKYIEKAEELMQFFIDTAQYDKLDELNAELRKFLQNN